MDVEHVEAAPAPPPDGRVLAAFRLDGVPTPLTGGQGRSWLVGQAVPQAQPGVGRLGW